MFRFCGKSMRLACKFYDPLLLRYFGSNSDMLLLTYFNIVTLPNGKIKVGFKINRYIYPLFYTNYLFLKEDKKKDLFRWIYFVLVYYPPFSVRTTFGEFHMLRKKKKNRCSKNWGGYPWHLLQATVYKVHPNLHWF